MMLKKILTGVLTVGLLSMASSADACTLYAAQGECVEGGGALITKIRDFKPMPQTLKVVKTGTYAYYGLFSGENRDKQIVKAGVNEKGLAVVTAMASCIPEKERRSYPSRPVIRQVLSECITVDEALQHPEFFVGPKFVMLADAKEIALVEIGDDGKTAVKRRTDSYLNHTNYYLDDKFDYLNIRVKESPLVRYDRINELMAEDWPYTMEDFQRYSQDQHDGLDNSLWRIGSRPDISQTLAAFIVRLQPDGDFQVWVKYRPEITDKGQEKTVMLSKQEIFK